MIKILLTSTSFQDTPGKHHEYLNRKNFEVDRLRGPLKEVILIPIIHKYDGIICGDDEISRKVIARGVTGKLKVISKYGTGVDKIDLNAASEFKIPVTYCPGVNQVTVAEHTWGLLLSLVRKIPEENIFVHNRQWQRLTGHEINNKNLGILGLGRVGQEVARKAHCFGMIVFAYDPELSKSNNNISDMTIVTSPEEVLKKSDILAIHMPLNNKTRYFLNRDKLSLMKRGIFIINTARGALVNEKDIAEGIRSGHIAGYAADVLETEPVAPDNPLIGLKNVILTPHIGSRTFENVERQAMMALRNLFNVLEGKEPLALANKF